MMSTIVLGHEELTKGIADYKKNYEGEMFRIKEKLIKSMLQKE